MQCEEFEDRLNAVLDERGRPELDAELVRHGRACAVCQSLGAAYGMMLDGFFRLKTPAVSADLAQRVVAEVAPAPRPTVEPHVTRAAEPVRVRTSHSFSAAALLTIAAGLLVAVIGLSQPWNEQPTRQVAALPQPAEAPAAQAAASAAPAPIAVAETPRAEAPQVAATPVATAKPEVPRLNDSDFYVKLAKQTGKGLASLLLYVPGVGGTRGIIDAKSSAAHEPAWAEQMSDGLQPVTDSVGDTLSLLLHAFPAGEPQRRS